MGHDPRSVKRLSEPGLHSDGDRLYLDISKTGAKRWTYVRYTKGRRRQKGLGAYPEVSLQQARRKRDKTNAKIRDGHDPFAGSDTSPGIERNATFGAIALEYVTSQEAGWRNPKHRQQWRNTLTTYAKPIWDVPAGEVEVDDVYAILKPIWHKKAETAKRLRGRIERVLGAATVHGLRSGPNPAAWRGNLEHLLGKQRKGPRRHHPAMAFGDVSSLLARLQLQPGTAARALELLIHTATRTCEILDARWTEFDLENAIWKIPPERMKAGKEHRIPLTPEVTKLIENLKGHNSLLFSGQSNTKPLSNMAMRMLLRRMDIENVSVHGFRSSFRDWCGECTDVPRDIAEMALAHEVGSEVERAYRRGDALEKRRKLMQRWSNYLTGAAPD
ncbi:tyrosine-type recombinase/integrase [Novosphingobium decolorationis]|uniref:tyrosine-type recombinase/integrase n=1 Tax=Novosphingobium decolorationis TaxID=2698673 RepID=UPI001BD03A82|nr:site-specific integrase [Novosphingobium decolorationis]